MSDNPLLDHYNILYTNRSLRDMVKRQVNNQAYQIDGISRDATEYTITDLTPYSTYCFWLRALFSQDSVRFTDEDSEMICDVKTPLVGMLMMMSVLCDSISIISLFVAAKHVNNRVI